MYSCSRTYILSSFMGKLCVFKSSFMGKHLWVFESMSLGNWKTFNVLIVLEHKLSILNLHYKKIEDIQSIYKTHYWNNILRGLIKAMLEKPIILFFQYNILLPQERYFVPTTYYIIPTRSVFLFPHDISLILTFY